jgi:hypothetical protein
MCTGPSSRNAACYEKKFERLKQRLDEPTTADSRKAIIWSQCERLSNLGIYNAGFVLAGTLRWG